MTIYGGCMGNDDDDGEKQSYVRSGISVEAMSPRW